QHPVGQHREQQQQQQIHHAAPSQNLAELDDDSGDSDYASRAYNINDVAQLMFFAFSASLSAAVNQDHCSPTRAFSKKSREKLSSRCVLAYQLGVLDSSVRLVEALLATVYFGSPDGAAMDASKRFLGLLSLSA
ncbi:hypothetical protein FOZ63_002218, partial [Perkinsus olseni]